MDHFGKRLRRLRGDRSQKEVAAELEIPQTTLSTLENQESVPRGEVVEKLADYFGVDIKYFYPAESKVTETARTWLRSLGESKESSSTVATHTTVNIDDAVKQKIAERIHGKLAKASNKSKG